MKSIFRNVFFLLGMLLVVLVMISAGLTYTYRQDLAREVKKKIQNTFNIDFQYQSVRFNYLTKPGELTLSFENAQFKALPVAPSVTEKTLLVAQHLHFSLNLAAVFRGQYLVEKVYVENAQVYLVSNTAQKANFDEIFKPNFSPVASKTDWHIQKYVFENIEVHYLTPQENHLYVIEQLNGNSTESKEKLPTFNWHGKLAKVQLNSENQLFWKEDNIKFSGTTQYQANKNLFTLSASQCTLKETNFLIEGSYQFTKATQHEVDVTFTGKNKDLGQIFALLPAAYYKEWQGFYSQGLVNFKGSWKGNWKRQEYPKFGIEFNAQNISIHSKHHVRRSIEQVSFEGTFDNGDKHTLSTSSLRIAKISGKIANKAFKGDFFLSNLRNPYLACYAEAGIDLAYWQEFYPLSIFQDLKGLLGFKINFDGEWAALKNTQDAASKKFLLEGMLELANLDFKLRSNPLIYKDLNLNLELVNNEAFIKQGNGKIGKTDLTLSGTLINLPAYLVSTAQPLLLNGALTSKKLYLDELLEKALVGLVEPNPTQPASGYCFQAPENIAFYLDCKMDSVAFRRLQTGAVRGGVSLKEKVFRTDNLNLKLAGGEVNLMGICNAEKNNFVRFDGRAIFADTNAEEVFYVFEDFSQNFIQHKNLKGRLDADIKGGLVFDQYLKIQPEHLVADIDSRLRKGEIKDLVLLKDVAKKVQATELETLKFEEMKNIIQIRNQTLFVPETELIGNNPILSLIGRATPDKGLDYKIKIPLRQNFVNPQASAIKNNQTVTYYLTLRGKASNFRLGFMDIEDKTKLEEVWSKEKRAYLNLFRKNSLTAEQLIPMDSISFGYFQ